MYHMHQEQCMPKHKHYSNTQCNAQVTWYILISKVCIVAALFYFVSSLKIMCCSVWGSISYLFNVVKIFTNI